jgi:hypothetical protein
MTAGNKTVTSPMQSSVIKKICFSTHRNNNKIIRRISKPVRKNNEGFTMDIITAIHQSPVDVNCDTNSGTMNNKMNWSQSMPDKQSTTGTVDIQLTQTSPSKPIGYSEHSPTTVIFNDMIQSRGSEAQKSKLEGHIHEPTSERIKDATSGKILNDASPENGATLEGITTAQGDSLTQGKGEVEDMIRRSIMTWVSTSEELSTLLMDDPQTPDANIPTVVPATIEESQDVVVNATEVEDGIRRSPRKRTNTSTMKDYPDQYYSHKQIVVKSERLSTPKRMKITRRTHHPKYPIGTRVLKVRQSQLYKYGGLQNVNSTH